MICPFRDSSYRSCPINMHVHIVKRGDTLYKLAQQYATTVMAIMAANPYVNPNNLMIGHRLCIPLKNLPPSCPQGSLHIIKPGDTLYALSKFYNLSLDALMESNPGIDPDNLRIGHGICIPVDSLPQPCGEGGSIYTVKKGDTFYRIAKQNNISLSLLISANPQVNPEAILPGQKLCIPHPWLEYQNQQYRVRFKYPSRWGQIDDERYEGIDGFFQIAAISSEATLEEVCKNEAFHRLNPYGTNPSISRIKQSGIEGCLILPSSDQPEEMRNQAAFITRYPEPIELQGQLYQYFILWASKPHIRNIIETLEFL